MTGEDYQYNTGLNKGLLITCGHVINDLTLMIYKINK